MRNRLQGGCYSRHRLRKLPPVFNLLTYEFFSGSLAKNCPIHFLAQSNLYYLSWCTKYTYLHSMMRQRKKNARWNVSSCSLILLIDLFCGRLLRLLKTYYVCWKIFDVSVRSDHKHSLLAICVHRCRKLVLSESLDFDHTDYRLQNI